MGEGSGICGSKKRKESENNCFQVYAMYVVCCTIENNLVTHKNNQVQLCNEHLRKGQKSKKRNAKTASHAKNEYNKSNKNERKKKNLLPRLGNQQT
jgi:hypothetical protein